jgi:hypothetical protein
MRRTLLFAIVAVAFVGCSHGASNPAAPGGTSGSGNVVAIVDVSDSVGVTTAGTGTFNWAGQSVTLPAGTFSDLRFNWYSFQRTPTAFGTLYLLKQEYLGLPRDLGPSTPGFVARSDRIENNAYIFPSTVTISGGGRYWFYTDTNGSFAGSFDTDIYPGGDLYLTGFPANPFRKAAASGRMVGGTYVPPPAGVFIDANFKLQGKRS